MEKTLSDIIREEVIQLKQNVRLTRCRPVILSQWSEIEAALNASWPLRTIWKTLHKEGRYPGTYESFRANVREIQRIVSTDMGEEQKKTPEVKEEKKNDAKQPIPSPQPQLPPQKQDWSIKGADWKPGTASDESLF